MDPGRGGSLLAETSWNVYTARAPPLVRRPHRGPTVGRSSGTRLPRRVWRRPADELVGERERTPCPTGVASALAAVQRTVLMMDGKVEPIDDIPAGNIVGLVGADQFRPESGTLTTSDTAYHLKVITFSVSPVTRRQRHRSPSQDHRVLRISRHSPLQRLQSQGRKALRIPRHAPPTAPLTISSHKVLHISRRTALRPGQEHTGSPQAHRRREERRPFVPKAVGSLGWRAFSAAPSPGGACESRHHRIRKRCRPFREPLR